MIRAPSALRTEFSGVPSACFCAYGRGWFKRERAGAGVSASCTWRRRTFAAAGGY